MLLACLSGPSAMMSLGLLQPGIRNRNLVRLFLVSDSTGTGNGSNPHAIPNLVLGHRPQKGHFPRCDFPGILLLNGNPEWSRVQ